MKTNNVYEVVTKRITDIMDQGSIPWVKPWVGGTGLGDSKNLISMKSYRGINAFLTMGFETPYFCTYKQAQQIGAKVKTGEKGIPIVYWGVIGKDEEDEDSRSRMFCKYYTVFNASQLDGLSPRLQELIFNTKPEAKTEIEISQEAELLIAKQGADLRHTSKPRAYYSPTLDYINLPNKDMFTASAEYYSTAFHELAHWTGHSSRLNRKELTESAYFGSHNYSQEELTAELTAAFVCAKLGVSTESSERNSAAYLQGWLRKLKNDPKLFVNAAQRAQKASDFILGIKIVSK